MELRISKKKSNPVRMGDPSREYSDTFLLENQVQPDNFKRMAGRPYGLPVKHLQFSNANRTKSTSAGDKIGCTLVE